MHVTTDVWNRKADIVALFHDTFTRSDGPEEGTLVGQLARALLDMTQSDDLYGFMSHDGSEDGDALSGCILFTRLIYTEDDRTVFLLSPVAVRTADQRKGIGRHLISHGLAALRGRGVDAVFTYGDPAYYSKTGFVPIDVRRANPPFPLTFPHGWLAQSLTDQPVEMLRGASRAVQPFHKKELW